MDHITLNKTRIALDPVNEQISPLGRPFRLSGIAKDATKEPKYINGMWMWCWIYTFRYTDEQDGLFAFYFEYNNKFSHKL